MSNVRIYLINPSLYPNMILYIYNNNILINFKFHFNYNKMYMENKNE